MLPATLKKAKLLSGMLLTGCLVLNTVFAQKPDLNQWTTNGNTYTTVADNSYVYIGGTFTGIRKPTGPFSKFTTGSDVPASCFPYVKGYINDIAADGSGGWFIAGEFSNVGGVPRNNLAHILSTGVVDMTWDPEADDAVNAIAVSGSYVYVGGNFTDAGVRKSTTGSSLHLTRLNITTGVEDATWSPEPDGAVRCIVINGSDIYVGGSFTNIGGSARNYIAKLNNTNGNADATWNPAPDYYVNALAINGSDIYAGGEFSNIGGQSRNFIARLNNTNGNADATWNPNADGFVHTIAINGSDVYAGGEFLTIGGEARIFIAKLNNTNGNADATWVADADNFVYCILVNGGYLYTGGAFATIGGVARNNIARLDAGGTGTVDATWDPNVTSFDYDDVQSIAINGSDVMVVGHFEFADFVTRNFLARFDRSTGELDYTWDPNPNGPITALLLDGTTLYVGGHFTSIGGQSLNRLAKLNTTNSNADATWNPNANEYISSILKDGTNLYVSGAFTNAGGLSRNRLVKLNDTDGAADATWNPNANNIVNTMAIDGSDIYVGGIFTTVGGLSRNRIAKLNNTSGAADATWDANANLNLFSIITDDNYVYAGGAFSNIGGISRSYLARLNKTNGAADNSWNAAVDFYVRTLVLDGQDLYVGGQFGSIGGAARILAARLDKTTALADSWNPYITGLANIDVLTVYAFALNGSDVYVGGDYCEMSDYKFDGIAKFSDAVNISWIGTTSSNWGTQCNWDKGIVPSESDDVVVPSGTPNAPDLNGESYSVKSLTLNAAQTIQTGIGTLTVKENLVNNGTINATTGNLTLAGTSAQQVSGTGTITNLKLNNSNGATITSGQTNITGTLTVSSGTLTTGGFLTLKSSATATARVAQLSGTPVSGNVTVERYIPAKSVRKWTYIACPVSGNTIRNGWQDDVFITGSGTGGTYCGTGGAQYNSNGFDAAQLSAPSMYVYNVTPVSGSRWVSVGNPTSTNLTPGTGYRMNIRGPRGTSDANCLDQLTLLNPPAPVATTLSASGTLMQGNVNVPVYGKTNYNAISGSGNAYTLIGNPYASEVSLQSLYTSNNSIITSSFWFYTPLNGSSTYSTYNADTKQAVDFPSGYSNGSVNDVIIASGQSFMVERSGAADANVVFQESHKKDTTINGNNFYKQQSVITEKIRVEYAGTTNAELQTSIYINYLDHPAASSTNVTSLDTYSFNVGNTFYMVSQKGTRNMSIQTRPAFSGNDTVSLTVKGDAGNYKLSFSEYNDFTSASEIKLIDAFLGTETNIRLQSQYNFAITSNTASQGASRFKIVFRSTNILPITGIQLSGEQKAGGNQLNWVVLSEKEMSEYVVERSADGKNFSSIAKQNATNNNSATATYEWLDAKPLNGASYYRIKAIGKNGDSYYSTIIKLQQGKAITLHVYPNPVTDKLNIVLSNSNNEMYSLRVLNSYGQQLLQQSNIKPVGGMISIQTASFANGVYTLQLVSAKGDVITERFVK